MVCVGELIDIEQWRGGTPKALTAEQAVALVRQLAKDGSYRFTEHALDRMHERHITATQVISVLKRGDLISGPERSEQGTWKIQLSDIAAGERITVTAAIDSEGVRQVVLVVVVVTVF